MKPGMNKRCAGAVTEVHPRVRVTVTVRVRFRVPRVNFHDSARCANRLSSSEIENRADASKISNVIETRSRNKRDLVSKGKNGIKNKTEIAS